MRLFGRGGAAAERRGTPADPTGAPYVLDQNGRVTVATSSPLYPLPVEPARVTRPS